MMHKAALFLLLLCPPADAAAAPVSPHQALSNVGQHVVVVEGRAFIHPSTYRFGTDIDLDRDGEGSLALGYIPMGNRAAFPHLRGLDHRLVDLDGVVQLYHGRAEIKLTFPGQIRLAR